MQILEGQKLSHAKFIPKLQELQNFGGFRNGICVYPVSHYLHLCWLFPSSDIDTKLGN